MDVLERKVLGTIERFSMLSGGDRVVVGFSGGPDSSVLLHILNKFKGKLGIEILAVHLNHLVRHTAMEDEMFCRDFCREKGIELIVVRMDVSKLAKLKRMSVEEAGRFARYHTFTKILKERGFDKIAVAHHLNDNVETFFLRLFKGSSVDGLASIRPVLGKVVRPLIECTKDEILRYACVEGVPYVVDESNYTSLFERNYVRNVLIPIVKERFSEVESKVGDLISDIWELRKFVIKVTSVLFKKYVKEEQSAAVIDLRGLRRYGRYVAGSVVKRCLKRFNLRVSRKIIEAIVSEEKFEGNKKLLDFGEFEVVREYGVVRISRRFDLFSDRVSWEVSGVRVISFFGGLGVKVEYKRVDEELINAVREKSKRGVMVIDLTGYSEVMIRTRAVGDAIRLECGKKKVKDILVDEKVPKGKRECVAVVEVGGKVAGIFYGKIRVSREFLLKPGEEIRMVCEIDFSRLAESF